MDKKVDGKADGRDAVDGMAAVRGSGRRLGGLSGPDVSAGFGRLAGCGGFRRPAAGLAALALVTLATLVVLALGQDSAQGRADGGDKGGGLPALERRVAALEKALADEHTARLAAEAALAARIGDRIGALPAPAQDDEARLAALEAKTAPLSVSGTSLLITGVNVFLQDGSGVTNSGSGLGNLTLGYNASRNNPTDPDVRTGAHNLIVGDENNYAGSGGLVAGFANTISGAYATVSGGQGNTASDDESSVSGGFGNTASGDASWVGGGFQNIASGAFSSVNGGQGNTARGNFSSVSGGENIVQGEFVGWSAGGSGGAGGFHAP